MSMLEKIVVGICFAGLVLAGVVTSKSCHAGEPTQAQIDMTYALVYGLVAYDLKLPRMGVFPAPKIHIVSKEKICTLMEVASPCLFLAAAHEDDIYITREHDWSDPRQVTILAHEFVHFFDWVAKGGIETWCENFDRELRAYGVQTHILLQIRGDTRSMLRSIEHVTREYRMRQVQHGCVK